MSSGSDTPTQEFLALLRETRLQPARIARFLDGLDPQDRVEASRAAGRAEQRRLYEAVDGFGELLLADLVPPTTGEMATVRHYGRNTLPLFTHFEKRFSRPRHADARKPDQLYGFNFQALAVLTGPGYFVAREDPARPEVLADYRELPTEQPQGWPAIRSNERGVSRFVYGFMVDTLRRVSEHVSIGSAARRGRDLGSWFILCREA
jgi:hypothetical protein